MSKRIVVIFGVLCQLAFPLEYEKKLYELYSMDDEPISKPEGVWDIDLHLNGSRDNQIIGIKDYPDWKTIMVLRIGHEFLIYDVKTNALLPMKFKEYADPAKLSVQIDDTTRCEGTFEGNYKLVCQASRVDSFNGLIYKTVSSYTFNKLYPTEKVLANIEMKKKTRHLDSLKNNSPIYGTGFMIDEQHLLTNYHVVSGKIDIRAYNENYPGEFFKCQLVSSDPSKDLALLEINNFKVKPYVLPVIKIDFSLGSEILVFGFPLSISIGNSIKLNTGVVSSMKGFKDDISTFQISSATYPGNSGSPVFTKDFKLIGIINSRLGEESNIGYAIKSSYLDAFLSESKIKMAKNIQPKMTREIFIREYQKIVFVLHSK